MQRYRTTAHPLAQLPSEEEQILGLAVLEINYTKEVQNDEYGSNYEQRMNPTTGFWKA